MKTNTETTQNEATTAAVAEQGAATKKATSKKGAPKGQKAAKPAKATPKKQAKEKVASKKAAKVKEAKVPREFSKKAIVLDLLNRKNGATLAEIMKTMSWQKHYADVRIMPTCAGNPACGAGIAAMESA